MVSCYKMERIQFIKYFKRFRQAEQKLKRKRLTSCLSSHNYDFHHISSQELVLVLVGVTVWVWWCGCGGVGVVVRGSSLLIPGFHGKSTRMAVRPPRDNKQSELPRLLLMSHSVFVPTLRHPRAQLGPSFSKMMQSKMSLSVLRPRCCIVSSGCVQYSP